MKLLSNIKFLWILILILFILNLASVTAFWISEKDTVDGVRPVPAGMDRRNHFLKEELGFTPTQQAQFDSLLASHRNRIESKIEEIRILREELMGMMKNQEFTPESERTVRQIGEKQSELELLNYRHFKEVLRICNDEQKQIFLETIKRAVGPRYGRPGHRNSDEDSGERGRRRYRN